MDYKILMEKYWNGATTLEEENLLRDYFNAGNVDPELEIYRPLFEYQKQAKEMKLPDTFEEDFFSRIQGNQPPPKEIYERKNVVFYLMRIAAAMTLLLSVWFVFKPEIKTEQLAAITMQEDTFDNPEEAYIELKNALMLVSRNFEKGQSTSLDGVLKINAMHKMSTGEN